MLALLASGFTVFEMRNSAITIAGLCAFALISCAASEPNQDAVATLSPLKVRLEALKRPPPGSDFELRVAIREQRKKPLTDLIEAEIAAFAKSANQPILRVQDPLAQSTYYYGAVTPERSLYLVVDTSGRVLDDQAGDVHICRMELDPSAMPKDQVLNHYVYLRDYTDDGNCSVESDKTLEFGKPLDEPIPYVVSSQEEGERGGLLKVVERQDIGAEGSSIEVIESYVNATIGPVKQTIPTGDTSTVWIGADDQVVSSSTMSAIADGVGCVREASAWAAHIDEDNGSRSAMLNAQPTCRKAYDDFANRLAAHRKANPTSLDGVEIRTFSVDPD